MANKNNFKKCIKCGEVHDKNHAWCSGCQREYRNIHREEYKSRQNKYNCSPKQRLKHLLNNKSTVDRSQLNYSEVWNRLEQGGFKCEITGIPFEWAPRNPRSLSIDKIDRSKPYTLDNIRLVCWWINAAMGTWGLDELLKSIDMWRYNERRPV